MTHTLCNPVFVPNCEAHRGYYPLLRVEKGRHISCKWKMPSDAPAFGCPDRQIPFHVLR